MAVTDFIAAIELGSSKITGVAGKKNADGSIHILAYASEHSSDCIRKGIIYNLDKTTQCLASVIGKLEEQLQASIKKVYVGIGGQSLRSIRNTETKQLDTEVKISQALIDELMKNNREMALMDQEMLAVEPQEYKVGNQLTTEPVGIPTEHIEAHYVNIIGRNTLRSNIRQMCRKVRVTDSGSSDLIGGALANRLEVENINAELQKRIDAGEQGIKLVEYQQVLLGITKAALANESFLSAASFQETTRVLTEAAIKGKVDPLAGLKENVIIGKLIPAGTGLPEVREDLKRREQERDEAVAAELAAANQQ